ncbi:hypothetical protein NP493_705g01004 [Ridgeia piscesae]|uniref:Uncharacterized protein n=1 Tax=Ridgeia piscesae TaxID=27915 RepID=A0AAD9NQK1_RIDPI|nr:hypothetical protein NP493_705g01004 [Ridgeia piscesae]
MEQWYHHHRSEASQSQPGGYLFCPSTSCPQIQFPGSRRLLPHMYHLPRRLFRKTHR